MGNKKFFTTGKCVAKEKSVIGNVVKNSEYAFDRIVYAKDVDDAVAQVSAKMKEKHGKDTRLFSVVDFDMLQIDVFELASERYNWDAHHRFEMGC